ncbi:hypothetical protein [Nocardia sp. NPDC051750]|uniref:hypothetical protein n=1 Tax=Nocardia sp. NPDC051750 TaxID=3364325 RepID=UPI0037A1991A
MTSDADAAEWVPATCTLPAAERPVRVAEFDEFFASSVTAMARREPARLELLLAGGAEPAGRDLAARESSCCSFFSFTFDAGETGTVMGIEVPPTRTPVLDALEQRVHDRGHVP